MTARAGQTIAWDVDNRVVSITEGSNTTTFVYDGDGKRVQKTENGQTTLYANKYYEKNLTTGEVTTYYYHGEKLAAMRKGSDVRYMLQDHLSGTAVTADSSGAQVGSTMKYFPFGATRSGSVPTDVKFTGQRLDSTGLYYYGARYYDPQVGRFISPDSFVQIDPSKTDMSLALTISYSDINTLLKLNQVQREINQKQKESSIYKGGPLDPQLLNRYSYARNNPLRYCDNSGHWVWAVAGGVIGAAVGLGAYALTHQDNFQWGEAAIWAGAGGLIGATLGVAAPYVAPWAGATVSVAGAAGLRAFSYAEQYGIQTYNQLSARLNQTGLQAHHLIEQRFAERFGWKAGEIPSIALTPEQHQQLTNAFRAAIGYINSKADITTAAVTKQQLIDALKQVYVNSPELLKAALDFIASQ